MFTSYADGDNNSPGPRRPPLDDVLRSRSYRLLWSAQFAALLAGYFNYVAVDWLTLRITGSSLAVGAVLAAASVPQAALMLLGGAASDRSSPRTTMLAASLARGIVMGVLAVLTLTRSVQLWQLFAAGSWWAPPLPSSSPPAPPCCPAWWRTTGWRRATPS